MSSDEDQKSSSVSFSELILGFASAALYHIGGSSIEGKSAGLKDLNLARQNIEIIQMLLSKTKGNLALDEGKLLDEILIDLDNKYKHASEV